MPKLTEAQMRQRAEEEFMKDLQEFLMGHPYWTMLLGLPGRGARKHAGNLLAKAITRFPSMGVEGRQELPNRETRRRILKGAK